MGGSGGDVNKVVYTGNAHKPSRNNILSDYSYEYNRIRRINEFLYGLRELREYAPEVKTLMEAQARFFRAYLHFMLVRGMAASLSVIILMAPMRRSRRGPEESAGTLSKRLEFAAENLPDEWDKANFGRLTRGPSTASCRAPCSREALGQGSRSCPEGNR